MANKKSGRKTLQKKPRFLQVFFAVTTTSVYKAVIGGEKDIPYVEKIAVRKRSKVAVGAKISNGTMLSVGKWLNLFIPEGSGRLSPMSTFEREIAKVNTSYWGGGTSSVVALFLKEKDALACNKATGLLPKDNRWRQDTIRVLRAIGKDHPYCSITEYPDMELVPENEWFQ